MAPKRNFTRPSGWRDSKLIVIATEGKETEKEYFSELSKAFPNPRVHVEVLPKSSSSDPARTMEDLNLFSSRYNIRKGFDLMWLVIDVDRWGDKKLSEVAQACIQKKYCLAVSNPAFEIWLLFHLVSFANYSEIDKQDLLINKKDGERTRLDKELVTLLGEYNKSNPRLTKVVSKVRHAIAEARAVDVDTALRWPITLGTRVYLLVEQIISPA